MPGSPDRGGAGEWSARSVREAEAAGPRDLLAGGQGELQEAERLELARPAHGAGVLRAQPARGDDAGEQRLGVRVVPGDEDRGGQGADGPGGEGAGEGRVE